VARADLVVTGEGSVDAQSAQGKLLSVLAARAGAVPVFVAAGRCTIPESGWAAAEFMGVYPLDAYTDADTEHNPALSVELLERFGQDIDARHASHLS
jgi:glycerate kinase